MIDNVSESILALPQKVELTAEQFKTILEKMDGQAKALHEAQGSIISQAEDIQELREENRALKEQIKALENWQETYAGDFADLARRVKKIETPEDKIGKTEEERLTRIKDYLEAHPKHAASFAELRGVLKVSDSCLSKLVHKLDTDRYAIAKSAINHRSRVLILKPVI